MKEYELDLTNRDIEVILSWLEDRIGAGHWGDNMVMSEGQEDLLKLFNTKKPGLYRLNEEQILQIIHDAEKCFSGKFGMFNPVGSIYEISTLYKLNLAIGKDKKFLEDWKISEKQIKEWMKEY